MGLNFVIFGWRSRSSFRSLLQDLFHHSSILSDGNINPFFSHCVCVVCWSRQVLWDNNDTEGLVSLYCCLYSSLARFPSFHRNLLAVDRRPYPNMQSKKSIRLDIHQNPSQRILVQQPPPTTKACGYLQYIIHTQVKVSKHIQSTCVQETRIDRLRTLQKNTKTRQTSNEPTFVEVVLVLLLFHHDLSCHWGNQSLPTTTSPPSVTEKKE